MQWLRQHLRQVALVAVALALVAMGSASAWVRNRSDPDIVVGKVPLDEVPYVVDSGAEHRAAPPPAPPSPSPRGGIPRYRPPGVGGLWPPNGHPPAPARWFRDPVDDSGGLQFVLVLGSDARAGDPTRSRADSIHILALDPRARRGTIIGIPRDSYVNIPGYGTRKINTALALGGPQLMVRTVRNLTRMPIQYYLLTAFPGFRAMVNAVGGLQAYVPYNMNDRFSRSYFRTGWHHMDGARALAFTRNRHIPGGDLGRSENQGRLMLDALKNLRARTSHTPDVRGWITILLRHTRVNMSMPELVRLGVLARVTAAADVRNVVAAGRPGSAGRASVVFLSDAAFTLFADVRADAVADRAYPRFGPVHPRTQGQDPPPG